jgi:hypothetical protein
MELEDYRKAFRVSLKLKEGASPHLYTIQLKEIMKDDSSLHPMMNRTLKLLKKTRTPYIKLSYLREVVFDAMNFRHFDRSAEPRGNWVCTLWSIEEIKDFKSNPEEYLKTVLKFFQLLGYELYDNEICSADYIKSLEDLTQKQIEAQLTNLNYEELENVD